MYQEKANTFDPEMALGAENLAASKMLNKPLKTYNYIGKKYG